MVRKGDKKVADVKKSGILPSLELILRIAVGLVKRSKLKCIISLRKFEMGIRERQLMCIIQFFQLFRLLKVV